jgi:AcrR family transcriptional regulator
VPRSAPADAQADLSPGARIIDAAYELFSHYGVRPVGVDRIIDEARVTKRTFYRHHASKDQLVLAFLEERHRRWTRDWLQAAIERVAADPAERTLAVFDVLDQWFRGPDYEGCSFIRTLHEVPTGALHDATVRQLELVREMVAQHAGQAGVADPEAFSYQIQILMMGSMVSALRGDTDAARRAREVAAALLKQAL